MGLWSLYQSYITWSYAGAGFLLTSIPLAIVWVLLLLAYYRFHATLDNWRDTIFYSEDTAQIVLVTAGLVVAATIVFIGPWLPIVLPVVALAFLLFLIAWRYGDKKGEKILAAQKLAQANSQLNEVSSMYAKFAIAKDIGLSLTGEPIKLVELLSSWHNNKTATLLRGEYYRSLPVAKDTDGWETLLLERMRELQNVVTGDK